MDAAPPPDLWFLENLPAPGAPRFWDSPHGLRVAWAESGVSTGRPVFFYHGWPSSRLQGSVLHHLALQRNLRVITLDRPGIGESTFVPHRKLTDWPPLIAAFADAHGIGRFAQLAVSGGGPYVLACAAVMPERLTASAVLCGALPLADTGLCGFHPAYRLLSWLRWLPGPVFSLPLMLAGRLAGGDPEQVPLRWIIGSLAEPDRLLLREHSGIFRALAGSFQEGLRQGGRGVMADAEIYAQKWGIRLDAIQHPIRYWHGGMDRNIPAAAVGRFVSRIPSASLVVDPHEGHFSLAVHRAVAAMDHLAAAD